MEQLRRGHWEALDMRGEPLEPLATPETKNAEPSSVYALSKYDQEQICLIVGSAYHIPTVALRFFNAYGPRQALSNPYTGVLAIFASRYLNHKPPVIFEDGQQRRDFVHVRDVAKACRLAMETPEAAGEVFNIGSGESHTIRQVASIMAAALELEQIEPEVSQQYRTGDIRHCFADIRKAQRILGYQPAITLRAGIEDLTDWLKGQVAEDFTEQAREELLERGLAV
jgi:dTDP-L-rhamnose 4-epimerase